MIKKTLLYTLVLCLLVSGCTYQKTASATNQSVSIKDLRCENRIDPLGIDITIPRFSWILESSENAQKQTAYRLQVASSPDKLTTNKCDIWDSGKVQSDQTFAIEYKGQPLVSNTDYFWRVQIWDKDQTSSCHSNPAKFSTGLLNQADWKAQWIGHDIVMPANEYLKIISQATWIWNEQDAQTSADPGSVYFRKSFYVPDAWKIKDAVCYITADDSFQLFINGNQVKAASGWGTLNQLYLDDYLTDGKNIIAVKATNASESRNPAGLILAMEIQSESGHSMMLTTNKQWLTASDELENWNKIDLNDSNWSLACESLNFGEGAWSDIRLAQQKLPPARYLRHSFNTENKEIQQAYLYTTALGIHQLFINGSLVNDDYFSPGWTDYKKRVYYRTYDVTNMLNSGHNAISAILADGWFSGNVGFERKRNHYGKNPRLMSQINIKYTDGSTEIIATTPEWKSSTGPIQQADLLIGEIYDATKEMPNWTSSKFDDTNWSPVNVGTDEVNPIIQAAVSEPVVVFAEINPIEITEPTTGIYVFNMGQNFAGIVKIKVKGDSGQKIRIRHAERLNPDGTIYTTNLRFADATDAYICKGSGTETWQPYFTFHGFQYVEIVGLKYKPELDAVTGLALSSDTPDVGTFECSDPVVNKIQQNSLWTQRMNFIDVPTDCPQRDERLGWTGDAQIYINTACYHNDVQAFFTKWLTDLNDAQGPEGQFPQVAPVLFNCTDGGPAWSDAGVICPWTIYKMYGDKRILEQSYAPMKKFIEYTKSRCNDQLLPPENYHCFGDWLNVNDDTPKDIIFMAYFAYSTELLANSAEALNKTQDAAIYNKLSDDIKASFNKAFVKPDGKIQSDTQSAYVMAIAYDLLSPENEKLAAKHLARRIKECDSHLSTGFIGTKDLMLALAKINRNDIAYTLLHNDTYPSWGFSIKHGATSIWERWNGWTPENGFENPGMNSFAHYSFGAVCQWMFENIGGIKTDGPAFRHIILQPQPGGKLTWAKVNYNSVRGMIKSHWKLTDNSFVYNITIPPNTTATVYLPTENKVKVSSKIKSSTKIDGNTVLELDSGTYEMKTSLN